MTEPSDPLRDAAPAYDDPEAKRARAGVAAALFGAVDPPEPVRVGRYQLAGRLGAGGMGVVYRGHDPELDRPVAVKLLREEVSGDGKARARMLREARALAKLSHPNVITVFDVGTVDGESGPVFVAMELVAGKDLRKWLAERRSEPSAWGEVLDHFLAAGRGLQAAHEAGLIHRDFKPENVLVGDDGRVRVLDFGLARVTPPTSGAPSGDPGTLAGLPTLKSGGDLDGSLTETGAVLGTPLYMAPELYAGSPADAASDQFAFAASLWEGLYGSRPFGAEKLAAHIDAVRAGAVVDPPADSNVPLDVHRILRRGLERDPKARHPNMRSLLDELERVVRQPSGSSVVTPESSGGWKIGVAVAVVLAAVVGLVGLELGLFGGDPPVAEARDPAGPIVAETVAPTNGTATSGPEPTVGTPETSGSTETTESTDETDATTEPLDQTGREPDPAPDPAGPTWCHLHQDSYTLLARTQRKRAKLTHEGTCYVCRVETRRSRTQGFSPRDCAGYSLCGAGAADECE